MSVTFIEEVCAELKRRRPGLVTTIGWKARSAHSKPPCVRFVIDATDFVPPMQRYDDEQLSQPLMGRMVRWSVECWGTDLGETEALVKDTLRAFHHLGTGASYSPSAEVWTGLEGSGGAILGELATLSIGVRDDVTDDPEPTAEAPLTAPPPTGGFT